MDDIVLEETYPYSIDQVWEGLVDPESLAEWLMPGDFKPIVGHKVRFHCEPKGDFDGVVDVEVLEVDRPRRLSYSWKTSGMTKPTTVTYTLSSTPDGGTRLVLEHRGFEGDAGRAARALFKGGWPNKLEELLPAAIARRAMRSGGPAIERGEAMASIKDVARRLAEEVFSRGDMRTFDEIFAESYRHHNMPVPDIPGTKEGFRRLVMATRHAFPDVKVQIENVTEEGDLVVFNDSVEATSRGDFLGVPPTGRPLRWTEIHMLRVVGGKIVEHWANFDQLGILKQLGAIR